MAHGRAGRDGAGHAECRRRGRGGAMAARDRGTGMGGAMGGAGAACRHGAAWRAVARDGRRDGDGQSSGHDERDDGRPSGHDGRHGGWAARIWAAMRGMGWHMGGFRGGMPMGAASAAGCTWAGWAAWAAEWAAFAAAAAHGRHGRRWTSAAAATADRRLELVDVRWPASVDGHVSPPGPTARTDQCRKWRRPVRIMAMPCSSQALDRLVVAPRAAGLDDRGHAGRGGEVGAVAEREEGVGGQHRAPGPRAGLLDGDPDRVEPAHLAGADADDLPSLASTIAFDLTAAQTRQAKARSRRSASVGARRVGTLPGGRVGLEPVPVLDEQAPFDPAEVEARRRPGRRGRSARRGRAAGRCSARSAWSSATPGRRRRSPGRGSPRGIGRAGTSARPWRDRPAGSAPTIPPKALTRIALVGALERRRPARRPIAAPQGLLCLRMQAAGSANWRTRRRALSRSSRLL